MAKTVTEKQVKYVSETHREIHEFKTAHEQKKTEMQKLIGLKHSGLINHIQEDREYISRVGDLIKAQLKVLAEEMVLTKEDIEVSKVFVRKIKATSEKVTDEDRELIDKTTPEVSAEVLAKKIQFLRVVSESEVGFEQLVRNLEEQEDIVESLKGCTGERFVENEAVRWLAQLRDKFVEETELLDREIIPKIRLEDIIVHKLDLVEKDVSKRKDAKTLLLETELRLLRKQRRLMERYNNRRITMARLYPRMIELAKQLAANKEVPKLSGLREQIMAKYKEIDAKQGDLAESLNKEASKVA